MSSNVRPYRQIQRRKCRQIMVGNVPVGGDAPITVQTMTNTLTSDAKATIAQVQAAEAAGVDIVRVSCPDEESTKALSAIVKAAKVPIVADIHFHYKRAIEAAKAGAACLRINPGNIGTAERVREVIKAAKDNNCSMRIGVNAGSLERDLLEKYGEPCPEAMVESALDHIKILEDNDFFEFKISCKASDVFLAVAAYQQLAEACDYPLHLGVTEPGVAARKSTALIAMLQGPAQGGRDRARPGPDLQQVALAVVAHDHAAGVAREPRRRFRGTQHVAVTTPRPR
jgi:(E)-4-hydroxy-3-methylbut-2-enyl-diphosphate synthase